MITHAAANAAMIASWRVKFACGRISWTRAREASRHLIAEQDLGVHLLDRDARRKLRRRAGVRRRRRLDAQRDASERRRLDRSVRNRQDAEPQLAVRRDGRAHVEDSV